MAPVADTDMPVLLRGGPRGRWAYDAKGWKTVRESVRTQLSRGQRVVDDVLGYERTAELTALPSGEMATVWRWTRG